MSTVVACTTTTRMGMSVVKRCLPPLGSSAAASSSSSSSSSGPSARRTGIAAVRAFWGQGGGAAAAATGSSSSVKRQVAAGAAAFGSNKNKPPPPPSSLLPSSLLSSSSSSDVATPRRGHTTISHTAADAASSTSSTTASAAGDGGDSAALKDVQERLGVTLSEEPTVLPPHPTVIVISGPSGVGKDAVIRRLQELRPELHMVVTATSRGMRPGEVDGVDYFFVSTEEFEARRRGGEKSSSCFTRGHHVHLSVDGGTEEMIADPGVEEMIDQGELIEHAVVYGEYKGIPKQQVREKLDMNTDVVLRLDVQGAATVRGLIPDAVFIFLVAESEASLARRLTRPCRRVARKTETPDKLALRVQTAREETARVSEFDYVVINADGCLDETAGKLASIIDVEKMRRGRERVKL